MVSNKGKLARLNIALSSIVGTFGPIRTIYMILTGGDICAEDLAAVSCQSQNSMIKQETSLSSVHRGFESPASVLF
jgi:hypothetical protein